jgi:2-phosphosulfolactate phosphatase
MKSIEVCLSPVLFDYRTTFTRNIVVIVDVLRATTAFCAAFDSGVKSVIPVSELQDLLTYKRKGFLTAAEREGNKVDFADFGNSPTVFLQHDLKGKKLAYSTTNGTKAVEVAKNSESIALAAFANLSAVSSWLVNQQKDIVILCSGWKNTVSLEDTLCAGALIETLESSGELAWAGDAAWASLNLWQQSKDLLPGIVMNASHYKRLFAMRLQEDLDHCFQVNSSKAIPVWDGKGFIDVSKQQA